MKFTKADLIKTTAMLLCSTVLFCACTKNDDIVIKVNDKAITRGQYYSDFERIKNAQLKNAPNEMKKDTSYAVLSIKESYTNDLITRELLSQEFAKRNIKATKEEIEKKKQNFIKQIGSEEKFQNILKENSISDEKLNSDMTLEVNMDKLVSQLNVKSVTDSDAQSFYNKNKEQFSVPERALVMHILFETNPDAIRRKITDADKNANLSTLDIDKKVKEEVARKEKLAQEVLAKAKANPKDFAKLAKEYSDDPGSAQKGGDLGYITRETVVKEFGDAAFSQKIGVVGSLVKTQFGQHIILVKDRSAKGMQPFNEVKNDLKIYLNQKNKFEAVQKLMKGLKDSAKIEYFDESLKPEEIQKQLNDAFRVMMEQQQKAATPKSKQKVLEKMDK